MYVLWVGDCHICELPSTIKYCFSKKVPWNCQPCTKHVYSSVRGLNSHFLKPNFLNIGYRNISDRLIKAMEQELNPAPKIPHRTQYWCHQHQKSFREGWRTSQPLPFSSCKLILVIKIGHKTFHTQSNITTSVPQVLWYLMMKDESCLCCCVMDRHFRSGQMRVEEKEAKEELNWTNF